VLVTTAYAATDGNRDEPNYRGDHRMDPEVIVLRQVNQDLDLDPKNEISNEGKVHWLLAAALLGLRLVMEHPSE
jgi:hypothetical protein